MKKLRLKALSLGAREILSREQLRSITGGCDNNVPCPGGEWCDAGICRQYGGTGGASASGGSGCPTGEVPCGNCGCQSQCNGGCAI
jgi:hypothetical protein